MIGNPVEENPIDLLFSHFYERFEVPVRFIKVHLVSAEALGECLRGAQAMGYAYVGITVPYKTVVAEHLDEIDPRSRGIGAINLVEFLGEDRRMVGRNTDGEALARAIGLNAEIAGSRICILGAGGAARGIGAELARQGARSITITAMDPAQGEPVAGMVRGFGGDVFEGLFLHWSEAVAIPDGTDIVINATPVGSAPALDELDLEWDSLSRAGVAVDVITGPRRTAFTVRAHEMGLLTVDGVDMLVAIVHSDLRERGIDIGWREVEGYARELTGEPASADSIGE